jgi:hypothetical protein
VAVDGNLYKEQGIKLTGIKFVKSRTTCHSRSAHFSTSIIP